MHSILYAVIDTPDGPEKIRLSDPLPQHVADDLHLAVTSDHRKNGKTRRDLSRGTYTGPMRPVSYPGWTAKGCEVRYFALRHPDDPNWPAEESRYLLTDHHGMMPQPSLERRFEMLKAAAENAMDEEGSPESIDRLARALDLTAPIH